MNIYLDDWLSYGACEEGVRLWLERHGFDWNDFCINGIDYDLVYNEGDYAVNRVLESLQRDKVK